MRFKGAPDEMNKKGRHKCLWMTLASSWSPINVNPCSLSLAYFSVSLTLDKDLPRIPTGFLRAFSNNHTEVSL